MILVVGDPDDMVVGELVETVGISVGDEVGEVVGYPVGTAVGLLVGAMVGPADGSAAGFPVMMFVGTELEGRVGALVGEVLGLLTMGNELGCPETSAVAAMVGTEVA